MRKTDKMSLEILESLYLYARELIPSSSDRYLLGVRYTCLRDDLKNEINK